MIVDIAFAKLNYQKFGITDSNICRHRRIHDFTISRFPSLGIDVDAQRVEDEQELAVGQLHCAESVHRIEGQKAQNLKSCPNHFNLTSM